MKFSLSLTGLICCIALAGCAADTSYMPLEEGTQWSYTVYDSAELPTQVEVVGPKRVGQEMGYELRSPHLGAVEMGWKGSILRASLLSGTTFDPPMTLIDVSAGFVDTESKLPPPEEKPGKRPFGEAAWQGRMKIAGTWHKAEATLKQTLLTKKDPDKKLARSEAGGCRVLLTLTWGDQTREILTSYVKGRGIVRQTSKLVGKEGSVSLFYLSGPVKSDSEPIKDSSRKEPEDPEVDPATQAEPQNTPPAQPEIPTGAPATELSPT